jgi:transcriptional regulator with XRE-family HTH domain
MPIGNFSDIAARIRQVRGKLKKSEFADLLGIPRPNLSRYESGRQPPADVLQKIADYGEVTVKWLLTGKEEEKNLEEKKDLEFDYALSEHLCSIPPAEPPVLIQEFLLARVMRAVEEYWEKNNAPELEYRARLMTALYNYCARSLTPPSHGLEVLLKIERYPGITVTRLLTDKEENKDLEQPRPKERHIYVPSPEPPVKIQEFLFAEVLRAVEDFWGNCVPELEHRARIMTALYNYCTRSLESPSYGLVEKFETDYLD